MTYIGVDLHKKQFTVCYRSSEDDQHLLEFPTTAEGIEEFKKTLTCFDEIAVEATGIARHFVLSVRDQVRSVFLVNTSLNAMISRSYKKTDSHDAQVLALGLERGVLARARLKSEAAYQLRALLTTRSLLIQTRTRLVNYMHALLARNGLELSKDQIKAKIHRDGLDTAILGIGDSLAWQSLCHQMDELVPDLNRLMGAIEDAIEKMRGFPVLASIPGFGPVTIGYLLSTLDDIDDFTSPKAVCAYLGIVPTSRYSSGHPMPTGAKFGRSKTGAITRRGDSKTRGELVMSINRVLPANASLRAFYDRIKGRKGYKKARTAAARKLMTFIYFALKEGRPIDDFSKVDVARPMLIP